MSDVTHYFLLLLNFFLEYSQNYALLVLALLYEESYFMLRPCEKAEQREL